jgi:hypothetical protein
MDDFGSWVAPIAQVPSSHETLGRGLGFWSWIAFFSGEGARTYEWSAMFNVTRFQATAAEGGTQYDIEVTVAVGGDGHTTMTLVLPVTPKELDESVQKLRRAIQDYLETSFESAIADQRQRDAQIDRTVDQA